ncbi:MAG TPA: hypothetical protein PKM59_15030 [Thermodesulfobacteriota bacterium]|nr:hypothetical protein [Thermodesulfobacteriota bacterium]HNU72250.1 hypothetical protein [Thermodesulfobacteriota bacterium]
MAKEFSKWQITFVIMFLCNFGIAYPQGELPSYTGGNNSAMPWVPLLLLDGCPAISNGDFESGKTVWTEFSSHGWALIVSTGFPSVTPHSGPWAVWLGGDYSDTSYIEQEVTIPSSCPYLEFYHWIASQDTCGYDYGYTSINGAIVDTVNLCTTSNTNGWVTRSVDLSAYAGQTITLRIQATTDASNNSNWFIDDVSFSH